VILIGYTLLMLYLSNMFAIVLYNEILKIVVLKQEIFRWSNTIMSEINNFLERGNRKIVNIQVVKDFDTELNGVNYIVFYEEGADITF
jgi:hypothetical protein